MLLFETTAYIRRPDHARADMSDVVREQLSQAEVSDLGAIASVEQDVARLDVSVHDVWLVLFMEVAQPLGRA
jgi:hypothetical protein